MIGFLTMVDEQEKLQETRNKELSKSPTSNPCTLSSTLLPKTYTLDLPLKISWNHSHETILGGHQKSKGEKSWRRILTREHENKKASKITNKEPL